MKLNINETAKLNPSNAEFMGQLNNAIDKMILHSEEIQGEEYLENTIVDFFKSKKNVSSESNVQFDGAGVVLETSATPTEIDDMDVVTDWVEATGAGWLDSAGVLSLDTGDKDEGTGSLKVAITAAAHNGSYAPVKTFGTAEDWSSDVFVKMKIKSSVSTAEHTWKVMLEDSSANLWTSFAYIPTTTYQEHSVDISACPFLADIKKCYLVVDFTGTTSVDYHIDNLRRVPATYVASGNLTTITLKTTTYDISEIYFYGFEDLPVSTNIVSSMSLDGGTTWHELTLAEKKKWVDVSTWSEYGSFVNLKNIVLKFVLSSTDTTVTPVLDDFICQYKLKG